ncbi:putative glycoside hydrolase [Patescibacteria group bacterium]|nr:putative glycoside hydrolase [Patescibacteria group bacterium]
MSLKNINKSIFKNQLVILLVFLLVIFIVIYFFIPLFIHTKYNSDSIVNVFTEKGTHEIKVAKDIFVATHIKTPEPVKAIYMTSWVAGTPGLRKKVIDIIDRTEINSIIIDIKDYTGRISFEVEDPFLKDIGSSENRIPDIKEFIKTLHKKIFM